MAFFFLEHVPDPVLPGLLATLHDALAPGAPFFVAEGAAGEPEPDIEARGIGGRAYDEALSSGRLVHLTATRT